MEGVVCPECGEENPARAKFCLECGTALGVAAPASTPRESRRVVTVVFADMIGFTALGERLDQESLRGVMDRFYAEMRAAIEGQAGTLAKFIGDAVLAVWGTPEVREDDALRAVRAADAMRCALAGLNEDLEARWGVRVGMRTGVNTGEVVVDPTRPADLLVGDPLNVAARLEQAAADGEVLIGPETFRLVRDDCALEPVEPLALKGKSRPMPAWRLVSATPADAGAAPRIQAALVGREAELARLQAAYEGAVSGRRCRMVTVIGSPGLGKTRLVAEFAASVAEEATILQGRCEATGEGITFAPVAEVLRQAAGIGEEASAAEARELLAAVLPEEDPDRERVVERAAAILGVAAEATAEETFWALRRMLETIARDRPVVLVHDDVHWGQPTFLDLLEHLVEWVRDAPVLIVALARPELRETRPSLADAGTGPPEDVIALEPLAAEQSRALVAELLGDADLPAGLADRVLETTEGNPLFLGEMLRMLADDGVLRREGDRWVTVGEAAGISVPPTIQALLAARIERLADTERSVIERAAVIGHQFVRGAVAELTPIAVRPTVDGALETLGRRELVRPEDGLWLDERIFRFHHILIRDAAYRSLLKQARAELHERFADWLEARAGELIGEHEEVVAFHLEQAHAYRLELGPLDDAGRALGARAAERLRSAGCRALAREDLPAAINLLGRAIEPLADDEARRAEILVPLAEALVSAGRTAQAGEVVEALGLTADALADERLGAWATAFAAQLDNLTGAGQVRETTEAAEEAAAVLARLGDSAGEAKAHQVVAQGHALLGQVAAAEAALDRALVAARAADDRRRVTAVLSGAPRAALWGPTPIVRASGRCLDVVRILRMTPGNRHVEASALRSQAVLEAMRGRGDAAREIIRSCRLTLEELGLALELHETSVHAGIVELLAGAPAAAEEHLRAAQAGYEAMGVAGGAAQAAALLARALLDQGRDEAALEATRFAEEHAGEDLKTLIGWLGARGEALARRGEHEEARALALRAVELGEPTDALADKADALMALAEVERAAGDAEAAGAAAALAREHYAAKEHTVGLARAEALAGVDPGETAAGWPSAEGRERPPGLPDPDGWTAWADAANRDDWDAFAALFAPGFRAEVHEPGIRHEISGIEAAVDSWRTIRAAGARVRAELLATAGPRAALVRSTTFSDGDAAPSVFIQENLWALRRDHAARFAETHVFGAGQEAAAHERLAALQEASADDEAPVLARLAEPDDGGPGVTPADSPAREVYRRFCRAYDERDWDAMREVHVPGFVQLDRRALAWEEVVGIDAIVEQMQSFAAIAPASTVHVSDVLADDGRVIALVLVGITAGDLAEVRMGHVMVTDGERGVRLELFEPEDREGMLARFAELTGDHWAARHAEHARRYPELYDPVTLDRAVDELFVPDLRWTDRRQVGAMGSQDREGLRRQMQSIAEAFPGADVSMAVLGSLGRWRLSRSLVSSTEGVYEGEFFYVIRLGDDGRIRTSEMFDDEARAREWWDQARVVAEQDRLYEARDVGGLRALLDPAFRQVDLRAAGAEAPSSPEAFADMISTIFELSPDVRVELDLLDVDGDERVIRIDWRGHLGSGGGEMEIGFWARSVTRDGLTVLSELHADEASARARLGTGLPAEPEPEVLEALGSWQLCRMGERWVVRRLDGEDRAKAFADEAAAREWWRHARWVATMERGYCEHDVDVLRSVLDPDYRQLDLRNEVAATPQDLGGYLSTVATVFELAPDVQVEIGLVDAEGDERMCSHRWRGTLAAGGGEMELRFFTRSVDRGEVALYTEMHADEASARAAFGTGIPRLPADGEELRPPGWAEHELAARRVQEIVNRREFDSLRPFLAEDFRQVDHRPIGAPEVQDRDQFIAVMASMVDMAGDVEVQVDLVDVRGEDRILRFHYSGHAEEGGGEVAVEFFALSRTRNGLVLSSDIHPSEEHARAALAAGSEDNAAWAHFQRRAAAVCARDYEALGETFAEDCAYDDRRPGLRHVFDGGREAVIGNWRPVGDDPNGSVAYELVGTDGPRRAVGRGRICGGRGAGRYELVQAELQEVDAEGRGWRAVILDDAPDDELIRALKDWRPGADPAVRDIEWLQSEVERCFAEGEWDTAVALFAPGYVWEDRRPGLRNVLHGGREFVEAMRRILERGATWSPDWSETRANGLVGLARVVQRGTYRGGEFEIPFLVLNRMGADGRFAFGVSLADDRDEGLRLLEEWAQDPHHEVAKRIGDAFNRRDFEALRAVVADDFHQEDQRSFGAEPIDGGDEFVAMLAHAVELAADVHLDVEVVAVVGERGVNRQRWVGHPQGDGGGRMELLAWGVTTVADGRMTRQEVYDSEDEARAALLRGEAGAG